MVDRVGCGWAAAVIVFALVGHVEGLVGAGATVDDLEVNVLLITALVAVIEADLAPDTVRFGLGFNGNGSLGVGAMVVDCCVGGCFAHD